MIFTSRTVVRSFLGRSLALAEQHTKQVTLMSGHLSLRGVQRGFGQDCFHGSTMTLAFLDMAIQCKSCTCFPCIALTTSPRPENSYIHTFINQTMGDDDDDLYFASLPSSAAARSRSPRWPFSPFGRRSGTRKLEMFCENICRSRKCTGVSFSGVPGIVFSSPWCK